MGKIRYIFLIVVLFIVLSCQIAKNSYSNISITSSLKSRTTSVSNIELITLVVDGPGIEKETFTSTDNYIEVEVQNGKDRIFSLSVNFTDGTKYSGEILTDVDSSTKQIHIDLLQVLNPELISFSFLSSNNTEFLSTDIQGIIVGSSIEVVLPSGIAVSDLIETVVVTTGATYVYDKENSTITITSKEGLTKEYSVVIKNSPGLGISISGVTKFIDISFKANGIAGNNIDIYEGNTVTVEAQSIPSGVTIQWILNGQVILGESSNTLSLAASQLTLGNHSLNCYYVNGETYASGNLTINTLSILPIISTVKTPVLKTSTITLEWTPATDNDTASGDIKYSVVYSTDFNLIDSVFKAMNNTYLPTVESSIFEEIGANLSLVGSNISVEVTYMNPGFEGNIVYFTLLATDANGNTSLYNMGSVSVPLGFFDTGV